MFSCRSGATPPSTDHLDTQPMSLDTVNECMQKWGQVDEKYEKYGLLHTSTEDTMPVSCWCILHPQKNISRYHLALSILFWAFLETFISINLLSFCLLQVLSRLAQMGLKEEKKQDREKKANDQKEEQKAASRESEKGKTSETSEAATRRKVKNQEPAKHEKKPSRASSARKSNKGKNEETTEPDAAASPGATDPPPEVESSSKNVTQEAIQKDETETTGNSKPPRTRKSGKCPPHHRPRNGRRKITRATNPRERPPREKSVSRRSSILFRSYLNSIPLPKAYIYITSLR